MYPAGTSLLCLAGLPPDNAGPLGTRCRMACVLLAGATAFFYWKDPDHPPGAPRIDPTHVAPTDLVKRKRDLGIPLPPPSEPMKVQVEVGREKEKKTPGDGAQREKAEVTSATPEWPKCLDCGFSFCMSWRSHFNMPMHINVCNNLRRKGEAPKQAMLEGPHIRCPCGKDMSDCPYCNRDATQRTEPMRERDAEGRT